MVPSIPVSHIAQRKVFRLLIGTLSNKSACVVTHDPLVTTEVVVTGISKEHYLYTTGKVLEHLGLIVDIKCHPLFRDYSRFAVEAVNQNYIVVSDVALRQVVDGLLFVTSIGDDKDFSGPRVRPS